MPAMSDVLPLLPTTVVGAHPRPSWYHVAAEAVRDNRFGTQDLAEFLDHAVDLAVLDQERLGIDILTDGELRRVGAFVFDYFGRIQGLRSIPANFRRFGPQMHDMNATRVVEGPVSAPDGLGSATAF